MECEICGKEIRGKPIKILVEGSEVNVCFNCKPLGTEKQLTTSSQKGAKRVLLNRRAPRSNRSNIEFSDELVENYNQIIRRERENRGWSQEKLGKKIQEKESLIRKIENKEINPEPNVVEKLERLFDVKLREKPTEVKVDLKKSDMTPTLGDVVTIKKKKSESE
ncbi:MAG: multiprotein bridging factor aMBF1 [Candidatus Hadarchaeota archaeon]